MAESTRVPFWPLFICWIATAAALVARALLMGETTPLILDTDDAMRLTQVHDLLAGQGWYDSIQHRLNTPYGAEIHWSRLIDAPLAGLLLLLRGIVGNAADPALAYMWPLLLLGGFLWLVARIALQLGGPRALWPALLLPLVTLVTMAEFAPGRLDHHAVQILLALVMLLGALLAAADWRGALLSGIAAGLGLTIGIEALPMVAASVLALGLLWIGDGRHGSTLRAFGLALAATTLLGLMSSIAPNRWLVPGADAISATFALAALLCGLALVALSLLNIAGQGLRLAAGIAAGVLVLGLIVLSYPPLLAGPYGLVDPWLRDNWIDRIEEAAPFVTSLMAEPVYALAAGIPVLTAILVALWNIVSASERRRPWLIYLCFLMIALFVMALQIRAARFAMPLAIPGCAVLIAMAWRRMVTRNGFGPIFALLGSVIASSGLAIAPLVAIALLAQPGSADAAADPLRAARNACLMPGAFRDLAGLPPERVMAPIDLGSHLLLHTPHAVVAAPYHRNGAGVRDAFRFFNGPIAEARAVLEARGVGLVVICPAMREIRGLVDYTPDSFVSLFAADKLPAWLREVTLPGGVLRIYSVEPELGP